MPPVDHAPKISSAVLQHTNDLTLEVTYDCDHDNLHSHLLDALKKAHLPLLDLTSPLCFKTYVLRPF